MHYSEIPFKAFCLVFWSSPHFVLFYFLLKTVHGFLHYGWVAARCNQIKQISLPTLNKLKQFIVHCRTFPDIL